MKPIRIFDSMKISGCLLSFFMLVFGTTAFPQEGSKGYKFKNVILLPFTSIKNQGITNNCYIYAMTSLLESELKQQGKADTNFSEMYFVRSIYMQKAEKFMRMHGKMYFTGGGELNDVPDVITRYGLVPEGSYTGLKKGETGYNQMALEDSLRNFLKNLATASTPLLVSGWQKQVSAILDNYLGTLPDSLQITDKRSFPIDYAKSLNISPDNYILLSSFMAYPYYKYFPLEVPDNWSWGQAYNLPLDKLIEVVRDALEHGYTVAWAADDSEIWFSWRNGVAILPDVLNPGPAFGSPADWNKLNERQKIKEILSFNNRVNEMTITEELRQRAFDSYATTDDHSMHIVGLAKDQDGKNFFIVKNSWGTRNPYNGLIYVSEAYFLYKTVSIMLNKKALPPGLIK